MNKKNLTAFVVILLLFALPIGAAFWLFQHPNRLSLKTVNHGQLLQPLLPIATVPLTTLDGKSFQPQHWQGQWVLMYVHPDASCDASCQKNIYYLRQIRLALGKNQQHVLRAYVTTGTPSRDLQQLLAQSFAGTDVLQTQSIALQKFLAGAEKDQDHQAQLLVVDPQGYAMMRYPNTFTAQDVLADLNRLLQVN